MGTNTPKRNRPDQTSADLKLIDGFSKHGAAMPSILIANAPLTAAQIVAVLQERIDAASTVNSTKATWQNAIVAEAAERARTKALVSNVRKALLVAFAEQVDVLAAFGLSLRKPPVVTPETQVAAAEKARATRALRHTMGTKQRAAIKAGSTQEAPTPPPATPAAPAPATTTPATRSS